MEGHAHDAAQPRPVLLESRRKDGRLQGPDDEGACDEHDESAQWSREEAEEEKEEEQEEEGEEGDDL